MYFTWTKQLAIHLLLHTFKLTQWVRVYAHDTCTHTHIHWYIRTCTYTHMHTHTLTLTHTHTHTRTHMHTRTTCRVNALSISDDSTLLAGSLNDSTVRLWTLTPKKLCPLKPPSQMQLVSLAAGMVLDYLHT